jgi:hypothetical protein
MLHVLCTTYKNKAGFQKPTQKQERLNLDTQKKSIATLEKRGVGNGTI